MRWLPSRCRGSADLPGRSRLRELSRTRAADTIDSVCNGALSDIVLPFAMKCAIFTGSNFEYNASGERMTEDLTVLSHVLLVLSQYIPGAVDPEPILRAPLECSDNEMTFEFPEKRVSGTTFLERCGVRFRYPRGLARQCRFVKCHLTCCLLVGAPRFVSLVAPSGSRQGTRTLWSSHARDEERLHRDHVPPSLSVARRNGRLGFLGKRPLTFPPAPLRTALRPGTPRRPSLSLSGIVFWFVCSPRLLVCSLGCVVVWYHSLGLLSVSRLGPGVSFSSGGLSVV